MPTKTIIAYSRAIEPVAAARELATKVRGAMDGSPDALILFASPAYDQGALVRAVHQACQPKVLVGASSAGEFTSETRGTGLVCALALQSSEMRFAAGIGRGVGGDRAAAARAIVSTFRGAVESAPLFRSALVMTDALAGHADDLVDELTLATSAKYQFFGGGAGDDANFRRTQVFFGDEAVSDAAVALEILSTKPIGIGVGHGWEPGGDGMRVTETNGTRLISLNGVPAVEAFEAHARSTTQSLERSSPMPFFLHNILGIATATGFRLRVPLAIHPDGSVECAAEIPRGAVVHIMRTTQSSAVAAAKRATEAAIEGLRGNKPRVALFFDCVATRLRMGDAFGLELEELASELGDGAEFAGCNTHGQIARAEGQFGGFHNCTAVVCVFPE